MTLLPIIYTSLAIFAVVMSVIIIVSYISYKAKQRNAIPDNSIYRDTYSPAPREVYTRPVYSVPQPIPVPVYSQPARTVYSEPRRDSIQPNGSMRREQTRTATEYTSQKRFQVMNNSRPEYISKFQTSAVAFNTAPAPEFNFLTYYSDQKEEKLNHISVGRNKNYR